MVANVDHFEIMITKSEKESLILEMNLIKKYRPRYNIMLKDNSHYPYIAIHNVKDPYVSISRNTRDSRCDYFGPYPLSSNAYEALDIINKIFPLRKCNNVQKESCLYYHLGQCLAPCINNISDEKYKDVIKNIKKFLNGDNRDVIDEIKKQITFYSDKFNYETAEEYKKMLDAINQINDKQNVELKSKKDFDVFGYYINQEYISIVVFIYRKGILIGRKSFIYELIGEIQEFVTNIILQYYEENKVPNSIYVGNKEVCDTLSEFFCKKVLNPTRGKIKEILSLTQINAKEALEEHFLSARLDDDKIRILQDLGNKLHIETPYRIELFDNSHLQGTDAVGAMVCFINGEPVKQMYRKFNIEGDNKRDDIASMKEVVYRRYSRLLKDKQELPDLIIADGGIEQINAICEVLKELKCDINVCGLAKNDKHRTNLLIDTHGNEIYIDDNKPLFFFLTRAQDEVHRFAIKSHINKRSSSMFKSIYDDIAGLGSIRIEQLNKTYPTIVDLKNASLEEFEQIIPKKQANLLYNKLKGYKNEHKD